MWWVLSGSPRSVSTKAFDAVVHHEEVTLALGHFHRVHLNVTVGEVAAGPFDTHERRTRSKEEDDRHGTAALISGMAQCASTLSSKLPARYDERCTLTRVVTITLASRLVIVVEQNSSNSWVSTIQAMNGY